MDIENHTTKDVCHLKYDAYNYFGRDTPRKVLAVFFFSTFCMAFLTAVEGGGGNGG